MNGKQPPNTFSDFLSPTTSDEGPLRTRNIKRKRVRRKGRKKRKQQREERA